jgi:tetratricopeptide (TPR) repeat protein
MHSCQTCVRIAVAATACLNLFGQVPGASSSRDFVTLRGEIRSSSHLEQNAFMVEIESMGSGSGMPERTMVNGDGGFVFSGVATGSYQVKVIDRYGNVMQQEFVFAQPGGSPVVIRMPNSPKQRPVSGTISARRLQHQVPKKARKEYERAIKATREGNRDKSIVHLQAAVKIDPAYVEAHNDLGARYLAMNDYAAAAKCFRAALEIDPSDPLVNANLALALIATNEYVEGERAVRRSLESDGANARTRYLLGLTLLNQNKDAAEALHNFRIAATEMPAARLGVAKLLVDQGDVSGAAKELQAYLADSNSKNRPAVEEWLAKLKTETELAARNSNDPSHNGDLGTRRIPNDASRSDVAGHPTGH